MPSGKYTDTLKQPGLQPFLWTQFLGALNDNVHKMVVTLFAADLAITSGSGSGYLTAVAAVFMLPFFLFSGYAGHLADVYSKRKILVATKVFEIVAMVLGFISFLTQRMDLMLAVVFLMALQSTFFSPSKYGILPEMLPDKDLSRANGLLEMSTFMAIILGTSLGSLLMVLWKGQLAIIGLVLIAIAVVGTLTSLGIVKVPPSGAHKSFRLNPWAEIGNGIKRLLGERSLWFTVLGIAYFWFLGALIQLALILLGKEVMGLDDLRVGLLISFLAIGIAIGSLGAGRLSGDKVELGLVPIGAIGMGICSILVYAWTPSYLFVSLALILLGVTGGLFIVPLYALVQQRSQREEKGKLLATTNFLGTLGVLLASGVFWLLRDLIGLPADRIILTMGLATWGATIYLLTILPDYLIRFVLWLLTHSIYKIRIVGEDGVPFRGPALLVCNHISHMDGLLVGACVQRFIRFLIYRPYYEARGLNWLFRLMNAIPVSGRSRSEIVESVERAREELRQGHVVCIFAEGAISRTGNLLPFKRGFEKIVEGLDVPVIPVYLDRLWGSIFSFKEGRFFWKMPERIPYPVTVSFGRSMPSTVTAEAVRQVIAELGSEAVIHRRTSADLLHSRFLRAAKRRWFSFSMADSTGQKLTYGKLLVGSLALSRWIKRHCGEERMVGLLLPASVAGALANIAVLLAGKIPVNLNFTAGREALNSAVEQCEIQTILTSRIFTTRAKIEAMEGMVYLEEVMKQITTAEKVRTAVVAFLLPSRLLQAIYGIGRRDPNSLATVVLSSGSTGKPKGVMLSHHNILANVESMAQIFWVTKKDTIMGVLPFFHSFGFTVTLWMPLLTGFGVVYHANPTDAKAIGELVSKYKATILIATPTFYSMYVRRCSKEEFSSLRYAIVGAEKLREPVAAAFKEKFGIELLEGYGCTEMGPVVSVNIPNVKQGGQRQVGLKPGTVGHPIPGVSVKVVDPDTGEILPADGAGMLLLKGPGRMLGYLGLAKETDEAIRDGWYVTGDIAAVDQDGFIKITDRLSRFSKIGGEMVPHLKLEETVNEILGEESSVVTAVPDEQKGERLVVFYRHDGFSPEDVFNRLRQTDLPNIWIPRGENIYRVDEIPLLGSGKVDLKQIKTMALERAGGNAMAPA